MFGAQPFAKFTQGGPLWLAARQVCAWTGTTPAKWVGVHPWCSRQKAYREAIGEEPKRDQDNWNLEWGSRMEPLLREQVLQRHLNGRTFRETGLWVKTYKGHLIGASPDGLIGDDVVLEIKASVPARPGKEDKEPVNRVPVHDVPQILMEMEMTDRSSCLYARYNGANAIAVLLCEHDPVLLNMILEETEQFWENIKLRQPPKRYTMGSKDWLTRQRIEMAILEYNRDKVRALPVIEWTHREA